TSFPRLIQRMYLWRRQASEKWWRDKEEELRAVAGDRLAIIEQAGRRRLQFEVASSSRTGLLKLAKQFGGRVEKLPRDWLKRFSRQRRASLEISAKEPLPTKRLRRPSRHHHRESV